jgi:predicted RNase H-like HicB family nuclease
MKRYVVVIEEAGDGYWTFVPDLPGCVAQEILTRKPSN